MFYVISKNIYTSGQGTVIEINLFSKGLIKASIFEVFGFKGIILMHKYNEQKFLRELFAGKIFCN